MPSLKFKTEEHRLKHNKQCREANKRTYYNGGGRTKSLIKYYKKKYAGDEYINELLKDTELTLDEKLKKMKLYNYQKRIENI